MLEVLSCKLILDFFRQLSVYGIEMESVQVYLYKKETNKFQFFGFTGYNGLNNFFYERYQNAELCAGLGDIWQLNMFSVYSKLGDYTMSFSAHSIMDQKWHLTDISQFDANRNSSWEVSKERQFGLVDSTIAEYKKYYLELYEIYLVGVYSPCYAVPPWTEYTTTLHSYKNYLLGERSNEVAQPSYSLVVNEI